jgi:hypothetical protein
MPTPTSTSLVSRPADRGAQIEYGHQASPQVGEWLRRQILVKDDKNGNCYRLVIRHYSINKKPQGDIDKIDLDLELLGHDPSAIDAIIEQVCQIAQADANALHSGLQTYGVHAYFDGNTNYAPRHLFRVGAEDLDPESSGADPSEPATAQGLQSQLMRHNEALMKGMVMNTSYIMEALRRENADQRVLIAKNMEQSLEFVALMQETLDNSSQRRIDERNSEIKQEALAGVFEHLKLLLPTLLNKIAGQKIAPETDPSFTTLAALFESMPAEQQQAFVTQFLSPAQGVLFAEFLETYEKRKGQLVAKDAPGVKLNLPALFDTRKDRVNATRMPGDEKMARMEGHVKSFADAFKGVKFSGPMKPSDK